MMPAQRHADARCVSPGHSARVSPGLLDPPVKGEPSFSAREGYLTFTLYDSNLAATGVPGRCRARAAPGPRRTGRPRPVCAPRRGPAACALYRCTPSATSSAATLHPRDLAFTFDSTDEE
jgi:hypothetical protein